jgi:hypothetical protein
MNATQKSSTRDNGVQKYNTATAPKAAPKTSAPPPKPVPASSAVQSPSAVPSVCDRDRSLRPIPKPERGQDADKQDRRASRIADAERAIGEVGHRGARGRGSDDGPPIENGVEPSRNDLEEDEHDESPEEQRRACEIAPVHRHGDRVAACFSKCRREDFYNPEGQGDGGNLAQ